MGNFASVISSLRNKAQLTRTYVDEGIVRTRAEEKMRKKLKKRNKRGIKCTEEGDNMSGFRVIQMSSVFKLLVLSLVIVFSSETCNQFTESNFVSCFVH
jgi:hypothetical protein